MNRSSMAVVAFLVTLYELPAKRLRRARGSGDDAGIGTVELAILIGVVATAAIALGAVIASVASGWSTKIPK